MANIDKLYKGIKLPTLAQWQARSTSLLIQMSSGERRLAVTFTLFTNVIKGCPIAEYLRAPDVSNKLLRLSKKLREFFRSEGAFLPGLRCQLLPHQQVSLRCLLNNESRMQEFGVLRGGVFADAPGLGKTVTVLALLSATAGTRPQQPAVFWDHDKISRDWHTVRADHERILNPVINRLLRSSSIAAGGAAVHAPKLRELARNITRCCETLEDFEDAGE